MKYNFQKLVVYLTLGATLHLLVGCGTIMYPERKGQISGQLDPAVALLNGLGLLFFFVPGVIAFAVDFSNGTIYLPAGKTSKLNDAELKEITRDGKIDMKRLEKSLQARVDTDLSLDGVIVKDKQYY